MNTFAPLPQSGPMGLDDSELQQLASSRGDLDEEHIPKEVRAARRNAAAALALSLVVFCSSIVLLLRTEPVLGAGSPEASSHSVIGLNSLEHAAPPQDQMHGTTENVETKFKAQLKEEGFGIIHRPYHLVEDAPLRWDQGPNSPVVRQVAKGTQVFPLSYKGTSVQVVVPKTQESNATFGWLPIQVHGAHLLVRDDHVDRRAPGLDRPPASEEELRKRWDDVRKMNAQLKGQIAQLQGAMKDSYNQQLGSAHHAAGESAKQAVNVEALRDLVSRVRNGVDKELKQSPETMIKDLGNALNE